jgi:hypothetical protein
MKQSWLIINQSSDYGIMRAHTHIKRVVPYDLRCGQVSSSDSNTVAFMITTGL